MFGILTKTVYSITHNFRLHDRIFVDEVPEPSIHQTTKYDTIGNKKATLGDNSTALLHILKKISFSRNKTTCPHVDFLALILLPFFGETASSLFEKLKGKLYFVIKENNETKRIIKLNQLFERVPELKIYFNQIIDRLIHESKDDELTHLLEEEGFFMIIFNCFQFISQCHLNTFLKAAIATGTLANLMYKNSIEGDEKNLETIFRNKMRNCFDDAFAYAYDHNLQKNKKNEQPLFFHEWRDEKLLGVLKSDRATNYNIFYCLGPLILDEDEYQLKHDEDTAYRQTMKNDTTPIKEEKKKNYKNNSERIS